MNENLKISLSIFVGVLLYYVLYTYTKTFIFDNIYISHALMSILSVDFTLFISQVLKMRKHVSFKDSASGDEEQSIPPPLKCPIATITDITNTNTTTNLSSPTNISPTKLSPSSSSSNTVDDTDFDLDKPEDPFSDVPSASTSFVKSEIKQDQFEEQQ
jgi:hypothetical protein